MKYFLLTLLISLSVYYSSAQENLVIENNRSRSKDRLILYAGISNNLTIYMKGSVLDTTLYKSIKVLPGNNYTITRQHANGNAQQAHIETTVAGNIDFNISVGGEKKVVKAEVRYIPDIYAALNRGRDTAMEKNKLLLYKGVTIFFKDTNFALQLIASSYSVTAITEGGVQTVENKNPYFNAEAKKLLREAKIGTRVFFDDIVVYGPDSRARRLNSFSVKVL